MSQVTSRSPTPHSRLVHEGGEVDTRTRRPKSKPRHEGRGFRLSISPVQGGASANGANRVASRRTEKWDYLNPIQVRYLAALRPEYLNHEDGVVLFKCYPV
jgi:hypothetical protein